MLERDVEIINKLGLHARAATKLANTANRFGCDIQVEFAGKRINAKSIMSLMLLAASKGSKVKLIADGKDQELAIEALVELIGNRFDEAE